MAYSMDTTLGDLLNDPRVTPIMEQYIPGISTNPMVQMAKGMSLNNIVAMPQAAQMGFTREKAEQVLAEVNKRVG
jgi:alpha-L-rhamnosidase